MLWSLFSLSITWLIFSADREFVHRVHTTLFTQHWLG